MEIKTLEDMLPKDKYGNISPFTIEIGAQKNCFTAEQGRNGNTRSVFIGTDKAPESPAAQLLADKGYTVTNEVDVALGLPVDDAITHHVNPLLDYFAKNGQIAAVSPLFTNSKSLRRMVKEEGALTKSELKQVCSQIIKGESYLVSQGLIHRDLNPGNVLIRRNGKRLESRLADLTAAGKLNSDSQETVPTGGNAVRDPYYGKVFSDRQTTGVQNDLYAIGMNAIYAISKSIPVYYNPLQKTGIDSSTHESILDEKGQIDAQKHDKIIERSISQFPKWAKKHANWIRRCVKSENRYENIVQLQKDFEEASNPTFFEKLNGLKTKTKVALASGLVALVGTGIGFAKHESAKRHNTEIQHKAEMFEAGKYQVKSTWNGNPIEIENNLCNIELKAHVKGRWTNSFPDIKFLRVAPGDEIDLYVEARETSWPRKDFAMLSSFPVQVYMNGIPITGKSNITRSESTKGAINSYASSVEFNRAVTYDMGGPFGLNLDVVIPTNTPNGVYNLSVAMYPPEKVDRSYNQDAKFSSTNNAISLKSIPIVVGDNTDSIHMREICIDNYYDHAIFNRTEEAKMYSPRKEDKEKYSVAFSIPVERETIYCSFDDFFRFSLPQGTNISSGMLQMAIFNRTGDIVNYNSVPIQREHIANDYYNWKFGQMTRDFPTKAIEERQKLAEQIKIYCATNANYSLPKEKTSK